MWKNYLKKAKNDGEEGLFIVVLLALKKKYKTNTHQEMCPFSLPPGFHSDGDGSSFVVDIFFGNPLLNLELFSEEL